jgi:hypothetical protein
MPLTAVASLLGEPTSHDLRVTGRAWIPVAGIFLPGTQETIYRYRGRGRILLRNPGPYQQPVVTTIERDPDERGW